MSAENQTRVILWAVPRSISTAFFRAMMNKSNTKVVLEPYSRPYYWGPDRISTRYADEPIHNEYSFKHIKAELEGPHDGYETVFVKDMAYYLVNRISSVDLLPEGYIHTFLLRDPHKSVYSLYKMSLNKDLTGWDHFDASEVGFKELFQMYELVTKELGQEAIILDADDLLKNPETMLKLYCDKVGIQYEDSMVNWDDTPKDLSIFQEWMPWFEGVLTTTSFQPSATKPKSPQVLPELPRHVMRAIEDNMKYYKLMHDNRLRPNLLHVH